nr:restriction endonuclease subunit S [Lactobacillus delbrueckii]
MFAWEQCKAKELFESKSKKDHSDLPVLSATQENGIVFRNDLDIDIKFDTHALSNYKVVSPGDYIISLRSFQGGFELSEKRGIISPAYTVFAFNNQEKNKQNSTFWKYLFKRYDFIESLKRLTFGIRDGKAISFNQFSTLKLSFPNFDEQNKIATLLHELDRTITLHEEKKRQLERLKRALLQKMFADKSGYPAVRFKGFGGNWKERKFGELGTIEMCKRIFKDQTTDDGEIPFYKIGTFGGRPNAYISREIFERYKRLYPYPTKGDILISTSGSIGRVVEYTGQEAYYQDSNIVWLNHNDLISNSFLKYLYKTVNWNGVEGSTIKRLYNNNILKTKIRIPSSCEQEKIGGILSTLDHLLSHHQQKIDIVKLIKQSLLQNMFI